MPLKRVACPRKARVSMRLHAMEAEKGGSQATTVPVNRGPSQANGCTQFLEQAVCSYCS